MSGQLIQPQIKTQQIDSGVAAGIGLVIGITIAGAAIYGIYTLLKR